MTFHKQLASQTAIYGLSSIIGRFLNYLLVPLYTGIFNPADYGVSSWFYSVAAFGAVIFTYGMETTFFRFCQKSETPAKVFSTAFLSVLFTSIVLVVLISIFSKHLAIVSENQGRQQYFVIFAFILAADALTALPFAWLRLQNKAYKFAGIRLFNIAVNIGLNLFFYLLCPYLSHRGFTIIDAFYSAENGILYMFVANLISSLVILPLFWKEFQLVTNGFDKTLWRQMLHYAWPLLFMGLAGMINETLDRILLKHLLPDKTTAEYQLGIYAANYKLSILMTLFIQAFRFAAEPFFFSKSKEENARQIYASVMNYFVAVCGLIFLFVMGYIDLFKYFIRTEQYWAGLDVVPVLLMANLFLGVYYNLSVWYKLADKTRYGAAISIGGAIVTIVLNIMLIPMFGYYGAAWATLLCYFSIAAASYLTGQYHYPIPYRMGRILFYLLLTVVFYLLILFSKNHLVQLPLRLMINSFIILTFPIIVFIIEKPNLKLSA